MTLRDKLIAEFTRIYFNAPRGVPIAHSLADAALKVMGK